MAAGPISCSSRPTHCPCVLTLYAQNIKRDGNASADYDLTTAKPIDGDLNQFVALPRPSTSSSGSRAPRSVTSSMAPN